MNTMFVILIVAYAVVSQVSAASRIRLTNPSVENGGGSDQPLVKIINLKPDAHGNISYGNIGSDGIDPNSNKADVSGFCSQCCLNHPFPYKAGEIDCHAGYKQSSPFTSKLLNEYLLDGEIPPVTVLERDPWSDVLTKGLNLELVTKMNERVTILFEKYPNLNRMKERFGIQLAILRFLSEGMKIEQDDFLKDEKVN